MPTGRRLVRTEQIALRVSPEELAQIDERAGQRGVTRTSYLVAAALGRLDVDESSIETELADIKDRLHRLEEFAFGGEGLGHTKTR